MWDGSASGWAWPFLVCPVSGCTCLRSDTSRHFHNGQSEVAAAFLNSKKIRTEWAEKRLKLLVAEPSSELPERLFFEC